MTEAHAWLDANIGSGWASCPLTQNGCIRIMSQPAYPGALPAAAVAARLAAAAGTPAFWPDSISLLDEKRLDRQGILGSRQVTDAYLLALAVHHGGRLVPFDRAIPLMAVPAATPAHLVVI